jgi:hypothetical protein
MMERLIPLVMLRVLVCRGSFFEPLEPVLRLVSKFSPKVSGEDLADTRQEQFFGAVLHEVSDDLLL